MGPGSGYKLGEITSDSINGLINGVTGVFDPTYRDSPFITIVRGPPSMEQSLKGSP